jgi:hypothetical protein
MLVGVNGETDDRRLGVSRGPFLTQIVDRLEAGGARHLNVDDDYVGPVPTNRRAGFIWRARLGDDFEVGGEAEQLSKSFTAGRIVVDNQHANHGRCLLILHKFSIEDDTAISII